MHVHAGSNRHLALFVYLCYEGEGGSKEAREQEECRQHEVFRSQHSQVLLWLIHGDLLKSSQQ